MGRTCRSMQTDSFDDELARLKEEHSLDKYSLEELEAEFHLLCGERAVDMCTLAAKHGDKESVMVLMNLAIHLANEIGAPTPSSIPSVLKWCIHLSRSLFLYFILTYPSLDTLPRVRGRPHLLHLILPTSPCVPNSVLL